MKKVVYIKILHIAVWPVCVRDWVCVCVCICFTVCLKRKTSVTILGDPRSITIPNTVHELVRASQLLIIISE